jgi:hypothetical protein
MRTKTLALSALLGALSTASVMSQSVVYSLNAVGYITITMNPGFNMIACQLITTNNTVGSLLNNGTGLSGNPGPYEGSIVYKFNSGTGRYATDAADAAGSSYADGWDGNGTITMNPGEAIWFNNGTGAPVTATFVGTVPQGTNTVAAVAGFNMISSPVPFSGDIVTNMGFTNYNDDDQFFVFNNPAPGHPTGAYTVGTVDLAGGYSGYMSQWDSPDPVAQVGQGFWYKASAPTSWVQVFSVNP